MLRGHKKQTRRGSGGTGRSVSPRPSLRGVSEPALPQAPVLLQKSTSVPSSLLDSPHNSGATWDRQKSFPPTLSSGGRVPVEAKESVLSGGGGHSTGSFPQSAPEPRAEGESEPAKMGSLLTEWFQKLFAPNDGTSPHSPGAASAAAAETEAEGRSKEERPSSATSAGSRGVHQAKGADGTPRNGAGKTSEDTDVPSSKTSLATADAARPPSPAYRSTDTVAAHVHAGKSVPTKEGTLPPEKKGGSDFGRPATPGVVVSGEELPPVAAAAAAAQANAGTATSAASSGASSSSKPSSVKAGGINEPISAAGVGEAGQEDTNNARFLGLFGKGGSGGGGGGGAPKNSDAAVAAAAAERAAGAEKAAAQAPTGGGDGGGVGAPSRAEDGNKEGDKRPPSTTAAAVVAAVVAAAATEAEGTNASTSTTSISTPSSSGPAPLEGVPVKDTWSSDNAGAGGTGGAAGAKTSSAGAVEVSSGVEADDKSDRAGRDASFGSGSGSGSGSHASVTVAREQGRGGASGRGSGSRSTSPARAAALSVGSDDGEEEHLYTAGEAQQDMRPSIDDFSSLRVLGKGSYGKVVLVRRKNTGVLYAMKILKKGDVVRKRQVERTKIERRVLGNVEHPFLMRLHYAFQTDNKLYLVLDYCPGGELFFHLSRYKRFPEGVVRYYAAELVLALKHLHDNKIIYRDIKPENILLDAEGHIKLGDFGLAKDDVEDSTFGAHSVCGTPEYMAPEVINKAGHGTAVDWWGLGMLMFEMLTGLPPWYTKDRQKLFERLRSAPLVIPKGVSAPASSIIQGLLTRNPSKRLGTHGALQVMHHDFFRGLDWAALLAKRIPAPLNPCRNQRHGSESTHNFDPQFTRMPIDTMVIGGPDVSPGHDGHFEGFTYEVPGVIPEDDR